MPFNLQADSGLPLKTIDNGDGTHTLVTSVSVVQSVPTAPSAASCINFSVSSSGVTVAAPTNTVGVIIESESTNSGNVRWTMDGQTATSAVGMLMEPGRDSNYIPANVAVSLCSVSGTNACSILFIKSQ